MNEGQCPEGTMPEIEQSALLPYTAEQMFALVNDIESYPEYMTGCQAARVISRDGNEVTAELVLGKAGLRYAFTTRNELTPPERMEMHLVEGPFREFEACWEFESLSEGACKVRLFMHFEFAAGLANLALRKVFEAASAAQVSAVCERAEQVYGKRS